jgi:hypothetical protein
MGSFFILMKTSNNNIERRGKLVIIMCNQILVIQ